MAEGMTRVEYLKHRDEFITHLLKRRTMGAELREQFEQELVDKLDRGYKQYGDYSYTEPLWKLMDEVKEEAIDIPGWLSIIYGKMCQAGASSRDIDEIMNLAAIGVDAYVKVEMLKRRWNI